MAAEIDVDRLAALVVERAGSADALDRLDSAVATADHVRDAADELLDRFVRAARDAGRSWTEIGVSLGVTRQAAQQRYVAPRADGRAWPKDFDTDARALVVAAQAHARAFRHRYVGTEHLLLALTADGGLGGTTLARLGVDAATVTERIGELVGEGHSSETATLGISPRTKRVLEAAGHEARRLGHRCAIASPEHVLLALSDQGDAVAARILRELNVSDDDVREQLAQLLAGEAPELAALVRQPPRRRLRRRSRARHPA